MQIKVLDGSNYFRGLLLLIRKDHMITEPEIELMQRVGKALGFEKEFCNNAIREILENEHISDTPPEFSSADLAKKFIRDGLAFAFSDGPMHPEEEEWLRSTALKNHVDLHWFQNEIQNQSAVPFSPIVLEVDGITVTHSWAPADESKT